MRKHIVLLFFFILGCTSGPTKIDPEKRRVAGNFAFRFSMSGGWVEGPEKPGTFIAGIPADPDGASMVAAVRTGPVAIPEGKNPSAKEIFEGFRQGIENDSTGGRVENVKSVFSYRKQAQTECLFYTQSGNDRGTAKIMTLESDGLICLHPRGNREFVWMIMSERRPLGRPARSGFEADRNRFFDSLEFL